MSGIRYTLEQFARYLIRTSHKDGFFFLIEDKKMDGIYERLFQTLFPKNRIKIMNSTKINRLLSGLDEGGKTVLEALHYKLIGLPHKIFSRLNYKIILDGNFQLYFKKPKPIEDIHVKYLKKYCIENYLIDNESIIKTVQSYYPEKTYDELSSDLDLNKWINEIPYIFGQLFSYIAFNYDYTLRHNKCLVSRSELSVKTIPYFFKSTYQIDPLKCKEYYKILKKKYLKYNPLGNKKDIQDFSASYIEKIEKKSVKYINGKYLVHSLHKYLKDERNVREIPNSKKTFMNLLFSTMIDNRSNQLFDFIQKD